MKTLREYIDLIENSEVIHPERHRFEELAKYLADLYYGDFSSTEKIKLAGHVYDQLVSGETTIEKVRSDIDMLEKRRGNTAQVDEDAAEDVAHLAREMRK